jgi:hypothetical protein
MAAAQQDLAGSGDGGAARHHNTFSSLPTTRQDSDDTTAQYNTVSSEATTRQDASGYSFWPPPEMAANSTLMVQVPISRPCPSRTTPVMVSVKHAYK